MGGPYRKFFGNGHQRVCKEGRIFSSFFFSFFSFSLGLKTSLDGRLPGLNYEPLRLQKEQEEDDGDTAASQVKILTSCPSCLQGLSRYENDADISADYIVVEMAKSILGPDWMQNYLRAANSGGIERVLL